MPFTMPFYPMRNATKEIRIRIRNESKIKWHNSHTGNAFMFIVVVFEVWVIFQFKNIALNISYITDFPTKQKVINPFSDILVVS